MSANELAATISAAAALRVVEPSARLLREWTLPGGISAVMTAIEAEWPDGSTRRIIVREPLESGRTVTVSEEGALLARLASLGLPVPKVLHVEGGAEMDARPWIALAYIDGAPAVAPNDRQAAALELADVLAGIHAVDTSVPEIAALRDRTAAVTRYLARPPDVLDVDLQEDKVRATLTARWPPGRPDRLGLLHGDFWPGNVLWRDGAVAAVIDWEEASLGDPLADVGISRLDILWAYGPEASDAFTARYATNTGADLAALPLWDLVAALRPAGFLSSWAVDWPKLGRPDVTADTMRADHRWFTSRALAAVS
jgi:aminoglycoside phosphotransferase (APT) family kinase protein